MKIIARAKMAVRVQGKHPLSRRFSLDFARFIGYERAVYDLGYVEEHR